jgi:hypothetical protein
LRKGGGIELFLDGAMEPFADAVGLRVPSFGRLWSMFYTATYTSYSRYSRCAVFRDTIGEHLQQPGPVLLEEGQHTIIDQIRRHQCMLATIEFGESYLATGIEEGLLVDAALHS